MLKVIDTVEKKTVGFVVSRKSAEKIVAKHVARTGAAAGRFVIEDVHVTSTDHKTTEIGA